MREDVSDNALLLDLDEAAKQMSCCHKTMREFIKSGELPDIVVGTVARACGAKSTRLTCRRSLNFGGGTTDVRLQAQKESRFTTTTSNIEAFGSPALQDALRSETRRLSSDARRTRPRHLQALTLAAQSNAPLTFAQAAARYYVEHGQYLRGEGPKGSKRILAWLTNGSTCAAVGNRQRRSREASRNSPRGRSGAGDGQSDGHTTAAQNRVPRPGPVGSRPFRRSSGSDIWQEPDERVRVLSTAEDAKLFECLRADYHPVVAFAIKSGCRLSEIVPGKNSPGLKWADVDWGARTIVVHGKGGKIATIPLSPGMQHSCFHSKVIMPHSCSRTSARGQAGGHIIGQRYPITREGLKTAWRRMKSRAGLTNYRFHDNRHTAATDLLRATGNLKLVQRLLQARQHRDYGEVCARDGR